MTMSEAVHRANGTRLLLQGFGEYRMEKDELALVALLDFVERLSFAYVLAAEYLPDGEQYQAGQELMAEFHDADIGRE